MPNELLQACLAGQTGLKQQTEDFTLHNFKETRMQLAVGLLSTTRLLASHYLPIRNSFASFCITIVLSLDLRHKI